MGNETKPHVVPAGPSGRTRVRRFRETNTPLTSQSTADPEIVHAAFIGNYSEYKLKRKKLLCICHTEK
jgi:hypothetical protein